MLNLVEKFTPAVEADTDDAGLTTVEYAVAAAVVAAGAMAPPSRCSAPPSPTKISDLVDRGRLIHFGRGRALGSSPRPALSWSAHTHSRNDSGLATVEFAIVGSLLLMLVFAIITVGHSRHRQQQCRALPNEAPCCCSQCSLTQAPC